MKSQFIICHPFQNVIIEYFRFEFFLSETKKWIFKFALEFKEAVCVKIKFSNISGTTF